MDTCLGLFLLLDTPKLFFSMLNSLLARCQFLCQQLLFRFAHVDILLFVVDLFSPWCKLLLEILNLCHVDIRIPLQLGIDLLQPFLFLLQLLLKLLQILLPLGEIIAMLLDIITCLSSIFAILFNLLLSAIMYASALANMYVPFPMFLGLSPTSFPDAAYVHGAGHPPFQTLHGVSG